jgi:hypothetical protein
VNQPQLTACFSDPINLYGNHLSAQFEKATAFAKRYQLAGFSLELFWNDLAALSRMLVAIYEAERLGKTPFSEAPEFREHRSQLL